jgi:hypothetical protein
MQELTATGYGPMRKLALQTLPGRDNITRALLQLENLD